PLTEEAIQKSNDSIETAMFHLGKLYFESLEDYPGTISTLDSFLVKFPSTIYKPEALFILHFCYGKTGNLTKADALKQQLEQQYAGSEYQKMVSDPSLGTPQSRAETDMNRRYENIYNSFIEGRFDHALDEKKVADSLYGTNYWTPQLLYIQSVFHVKQREDEQAKVVLQQIIKLFPNSPLAPRAETMLSVLGRRKEIEDYLANLKIERPGEDTLAVVADDKPLLQTGAEGDGIDSLESDITARQPAVGKASTDEKGKKDISVVPGQNNAAEAMKAAGRAGADSLAAVQQRQLAAARTADSLANVQRLAEIAAQKTADSIATAQRLADIAAARVADSLAVIRRADSIASVKRADSLGAVAGQRMRDSLHALSVTRDSLAAVTRKAEELARAVAARTADSLRIVAVKAADSARVAAERAAIRSAYSVNDAAPHMVLMILDKVDPVYVGEARNAFDRYHRTATSTAPMTTSNVPLSDSLNLMVISPFPNAASALDYTRKTAPIADTRIIPWMPKGKYSFVVINGQNLDILKTRRDLDEYLKFHAQAYSGK
ncbi:MAG: tetratricopeptide repeat protein, partial [Sphingobacteriales bacterium]